MRAPLPPVVRDRPIVVVPGIDDSGPEHWQSRWQSAHPDAARIAPRSFAAPELDDWVRSIEDAVASRSAPPLVIAHSLGCLAALAWVERVRRPRIAALVLVAVPDPTTPSFPRAAAPTFTRVPLPPLGPAIVIASSNDPFGSLDHATRVARATGARLEVVGALGHINASSGLGDWTEGLALVEAALSPRIG